MHSQVCWQEAAPSGGSGFAASVALAIVLAVGLIFGPLIADAAWDHDAHVTPEQAMLHWALEAQGIGHHHHLDLSTGVPLPAAASGGPMLRSGNSSPDFGTPAPPVTASPAAPCLALAGCGFLPPSERLSDLHYPLPEAPPPRAA
ncbi:MAG: hypothetical protein ACRDHX_12375 [Chloroflexota bacterium]